MKNLLHSRAFSLQLLFIFIALLISSEVKTAYCQPKKVLSSQRSFKVKVTGRGQPMILIPGLASAGEVWDGTIARYETNYECHVLTLAGFAGEAPVSKTAFIETVRNDLAQYIRDKKLQKPVIVGHSLGGFTALWLASVEPDLVGPLVIVDALPFFPAAINPNATIETMKPQAEAMRKMMTVAQTPEQRQRSQKMYLQSLTTLVTDPANLELIGKWGVNSDPGTIAQAMYEMNTTDLRPDLARIKAPTLVVGSWAGYRQFATREQIEKVFRNQYAKLSDFQLVMSENGKHFVMYDDPETLFKAMDNFLLKQKK